MVCEAHILAWEENETIHLTIKHYKRFCKRVIVYDHYSEDGTPEIARLMGCEVRQFGIPGVLDDREYTKLKSNCWKGSDADWVIIVDADEILNLVPHLDKLGNATILNTFGINVYSHQMPLDNWFEITAGFHDPNYSKLCCFNPKDIKEINYVHGCHVAKPVGNIIYSEEIPQLWHYRNVGGPERLIHRHARYRRRMSEWNIRFKAGVHYLDEDNKRREDWERLYQQCGSFFVGLISGLHHETTK